MNENDYRVLDQILKIAIEKGVATNKNLPPLNSEFLSNQASTKNKEYSFYIDVIEEHKAATVTRFKEGFEVEPIPVKTARFVESGGFLKLYLDTLKTNEQSEIKEKQEAEIRRLQVKELKGNIFQLKYWWLIILINMIISLIIAIFSGRF